MSSDLFMAILSMDAYNREYGAGISVSDDEIGHASITDRTPMGVGSQEYQDRQDAGCYALAYEWNGETTIAYRGTDNLDRFGSAEGASDIWKGWITGVGIFAAQSSLAFDFFEAVTRDDALQRETGGVTLTGHSLGGLAGLIAALSGDQAVVFDCVLKPQNSACNSGSFSLTSRP